MDKNSLLILVSEKLGISSSQKEIAFEMFKKNISETLPIGDAIHIDGLGYFQIKKEPIALADRKSFEDKDTLSKKTLFYSPEKNDNFKNDSSLFLSFDLEEQKTDNTEFDESIFSLGTNKSVIPIYEENIDFEAYQNSIEEKISGVLNNSQKFENFDLFENYINLQSNSELDETAKNEINIDEFDIEGENPFDDIKGVDLPASSDDLNIEINNEEIEVEEEILEPIEDHQNTEAKQNENENYSEAIDLDSFNNLEELDEDKSIVEEENIDESISPFDELHESNDLVENKSQIPKKKDKPLDDNFMESDVDILDELLPISDVVDDTEEIVDEDEEDNDSNWNWGDELKEELSDDEKNEAEKVTQNSETEEEYSTKIENDIDEAVSIGDEEINEETIEDELNESLEKNNSDEVEESTDELENEIDDNLIDESEIEAELNEPEDNNENETVEEEDTKKEEEKPGKSSDKLAKIKSLFKLKKIGSFNLDWNKSFGKIFWIVLGVFILFNTLAISYLIFFVKDENIVVNADAIQSDSLAAHNEVSSDSIAQKIDSMNTVLTDNDNEVKNDLNTNVNTENITVAKTEQKIISPVENKEIPSNNINQENNPLFLKIGNDKRVKGRIYTDGKEFMIQVSSFKSKGRAIKDVQRLRKKNHNAFIVEVYLSELGGTWYRVRITGFNSQTEAETYSKK